MIVFAEYWAIRDLTGAETGALLALTFAVAVLSWRFVERPFRNRHRMSRMTILTGGGVAIAGAVVAGIGIYATLGLPGRFGDMTRFARATVVDEPKPGDPVCFLQGSWKQWAGDACYLRRGTGRPVLLMGDSHAKHYASALGSDRTLSSNILMYTSAGCLPLFGEDLKGRPDCRANNEHAIDVIRQYRVRRVVLSAHWEYLMVRNTIGFDSVARTIARLRAMGVEVAVIGDNPDYSFNNPQFLAYRLSTRPDANAPFYIKPRNDWSYNRRFAALVSPRLYFDPLVGLCPAGRCLVYRDGQTMMYDNAHFSKFGAAVVEPMIARLFR